ncbi:MAG: 50S ribosomal protein L24 [Patescibacteria group bacterium]|jgi:large subunit ribosomal protein L24
MATIKVKLHPGDTVAVTKGKDLGKKGKIEKVYPEKQTVLVENVNLVKKHIKPRGQQAGGIVTVNKPIAIANVQLVCPACNKQTRVGIEIKGGERQRVCKKCGAVITTKAEKK